MESFVYICCTKPTFRVQVNANGLYIGIPTVNFSVHMVEEGSVTHTVIILLVS